MPAPTLIDRSLPVLVLGLWALGSITTERPARELVFLMVPLLFAVELGAPSEPLRMLLLGLIMSAAAITHVWSISGEWTRRELVTSAALVAPLRIVEPAPVPILVQLIFVAGAVALWAAMRRTTRVEIAAGAVLLISVSIPGSSLRMALVPWCLALMVRALGRGSKLIRFAPVVVAAVIANWLAAVVVIVLVVDLVIDRWRASESPAAIVPGLTAAAGNLRGVLSAAVFFPTVAMRMHAFVLFSAALLLALIVRPSLSVPITAVGIIAACVRAGQGAAPGSGFPVAPGFPSLVLSGMILVFFPWSGAIVARPPAPLSMLPVLVVAAIALLPSTLRGLSGAAAMLLVAAVLFQLPVPPERSRTIERSLAAGESFSVSLPEAWEGPVEVVLAGANLADRRFGERVATVGIVDAVGRGYSRTIEVGEIADWGAFRPELVLSTWNLRPERIERIEGYGIDAWTRGAGRVVLDGIEDPRWLVISADDLLEENEQILVEELGFR
ncbi:MAG: hypothetical protein R3338_14315 [Thermoanaerobaculia bacterium]|nr:hypothetical protein [Thermoanaerobaculia bacterium]